MNLCDRIREQFSDYLDGQMTGVRMQQIAAHLDSCPACQQEFEEWRTMQDALAALAPVKAPTGLDLRLRVAISREKARSPRHVFARWRFEWQNTVAPLLLRASAGFASAIVLLGSVGLLVGMFAKPESLAAQDEPLGMASSAHLLYTSASSSSDTLNSNNNPLVVEVLINGDGRAYDYRILSGPTDTQTRSALENLLLFSVFEPARVFGQPVRGMAVLSFAGVSVKG